MDMFASGGGKAAIGVGTPTGSFPASIIVKKAIIDAVIFESGLYVGPDHERNFDAMQKRMAAHRRGESPEAMGQLARARDLDGEAEAIKLREHYRSLPVLHKEERNAQ